GTPRSAVLTLLSANPSVRLGAAAYAVPQTAPQAVIGVQRAGSLAGAVTVDWKTQDGTAHAGTDYVAATRTLAFPPGVASPSISVQLMADSTHEGNETVNLLLGPATGAYLASPSTAVLTIKDTAPSVVQLASPDFSASQGEPNATIALLRTGVTSTTVTVAYATVDGTALAGTYYAPTAGTLTFAPGETSKTFSVPLKDDGAS